MTLGGSSAASSGAIIQPGTLTSYTPTEVSPSAPSTLLQVRLLNGKRVKLK